jgi:hypothetical protein
VDRIDFSEPEQPASATPRLLHEMLATSVAGCERDRSASLSRLGRGNVYLMTDGDDRAAHGNARAGDIEVRPAQPERLPSPHPRHREHEPQDVEVVIPRAPQKRPQLIGTPAGHLVVSGARGIGAIGRDLGEVSPPHCVPESAMKGRVDARHGRGREASTSARPAPREQPRVEGVEGVGVDGVQRHRAEPRKDVDRDVGAVARKRARSHGALDGRPPVVLEEVAQAHHQQDERARCRILWRASQAA